MRDVARPRLLLGLASVSLFTLAFACGTSVGTDGIATETNANGDGNAGDPGSSPPSGALPPGAEDVGVGAPSGVDAGPEGGPSDPGNVAGLSVTAAATKTIAGGAPIALTAAFMNVAAGPVTWELRGPGSLSIVSPAEAMYTPPSDAIGMATITARSTPFGATTAIRVSSPPKRSVVAYALADEPGSASYVPSALRSYNAGRGAITATRTAPGVYAMTFAGLPLGSGDVQVTTYGGSARCNVGSWDGDTAHVTCFDSAGAPTDSGYSIAVVADGVYSAATTAAYAWADPSNARDLESLRSYNSAGGAISTKITGTGQYAVTFDALAIDGGNVQVSAYDSDRSCSVEGWSGSTIDVRCYRKTGALADSAFTVNVVSKGLFTTTNVAAYARADAPNVASYTPSSTHSFNASGGAITAMRSGVGTYLAEFDGLNLARASVKVSAHGTNAQCNVAGWSGSFVQVKCYASEGYPVDSPYTVLVTLDHRPVRTRIAGYAWADDATSASYAPSAAYAYNASGGAISATRSAVGAYAVTFAGLDLSGKGHVQVTALGSNAYCNAEDWSGSTVEVRCYDPAGAPTDSQYVASVILDAVASDASIAAYALADSPSIASYTPPAAHAYNAGGGAITAKRASPGVYDIAFAGLATPGGVVHVNAYGGSGFCSVSSWSADSVGVRCFDAAGAPADLPYSIAVLRKEQVGGAVSPAYVRTSGAIDWPPDPAYGYSAGAYGAMLENQNSYLKLRFLDLARGNILVTPYRSSARCSVRSVDVDESHVRCSGPGGASADSRYTLLFTE